MSYIADDRVQQDCCHIGASLTGYMHFSNYREEPTNFQILLYIFFSCSNFRNHSKNIHWRQCGNSLALCYLIKIRNMQIAGFDLCP